MVVVGSLPLEVLLRIGTAHTVRAEVGRTIDVSGDVEVSLGARPLIPQIMTRSVSTVTVSLESAACDGLDFQDITLVGTDVRTDVPYVHDLTLRAVVTPGALQAALDRDGGESVSVTTGAGSLVVTARADDRQHLVDVSVLGDRRVVLVARPSPSTDPALAERIGRLSFDASCPVPFGWVDDATVSDEGIVLTGGTDAAALYEREAF